MTEQPQKPGIDLGIYQEPTEKPRSEIADVIAAALSTMWIILVGAFFLFTGRSGESLDSLRFVMTLLAIFMPVALIWIAATAAKTSKMMRDESARLQASIEGMRQTYLQSQSAGQGLRPSVERKLEEIAAAQRKTEDAIATFASIRPEPFEAPPLPAPEVLVQDTSEQGRLALGAQADVVEAPVANSDFIKALNFPENAEDQEGFRALRRALQDRTTSELVRSSQDVLTMLSHDGIYMDDLHPDRARPEIWRKFALGERGRAIAGLGGVRDRTSLTLTSARMREDAVFRDAAHHFLRRFDKTLADFEPSASDQDLIALSNTRTARAFMLLGRVTGTFT